MSLITPTQGEVKEFLSELPDDFTSREAMEIWKQKREASFSDTHTLYSITSLLNRMSEKKMLRKYCAGHNSKKDRGDVHFTAWRYKKV